MSPAGGRQPVPHNVFAIEDQRLVLPDAVALDTSFVVEALIATEPLHAVCNAFLTRIDESGTSVITNALLRAELAEASFAAGAETMVTTDTGFGLMPASLLTIYTERSRLASCRRNRPRR
jgi:hypothetical protein